MIKSKSERVADAEAFVRRTLAQHQNSKIDDAKIKIAAEKIVSLLRLPHDPW